MDNSCGKYLNLEFLVTKLKAYENFKPILYLDTYLGEALVARVGSTTLVIYSSENVKAFTDKKEVIDYLKFVRVQKAA